MVLAPDLKTTVHMKTIFFAGFALAKYELLDKMHHGETRVIHCRGGSGRTGLMAAILLLENGANWSGFQTQVQSLRPEARTSPSHRNFIYTRFSIMGNYDN